MELTDIPNERSSHQLPTPRGGGLAISTAFTLTSTLLLILDNQLALPASLILLVTFMAVLGALDDFKNLSVRSRLFVQALLAIIGTYICLVKINEPTLHLIIAGCLVAFALMWITNLYNFMDGINGIAAIQAITTCFSMSFILITSNSDVRIIAHLMILGFSCLGFLYWNFPKAKIFMGDSGSLFLGFTLGLIAIETTNTLETGVSWLILLAVFISDASYTLCTRLFSGQKYYLPHRSHTYQKIAQKLGSHTQTTLLVFAVNLFWLLPLALAANSKLLDPMWALVIAYCPLIFCSIWIKAGKQIS